MSEYIYKKYTLGTRYTSWSSETKEGVKYNIHTFSTSELVWSYNKPTWDGNGYKAMFEPGPLGKVAERGRAFMIIDNGSTRAEWASYQVGRSSDSITKDTVKTTEVVARCFRTRSSYYVKGEYIEDVVAEDGTYPDDGKSGGYWYVRGGLAFPEFKMRIGGVLKTSENGWVKINGQLREIDTIWTKINGALREVE